MVGEQIGMSGRLGECLSGKVVFFRHDAQGIDPLSTQLFPISGIEQLRLVHSHLTNRDPNARKLDTGQVEFDRRLGDGHSPQV